MASVETLRPLMQSVVGGVRAYFAPVRRDVGLPATFDPAVGAFDLDGPPAPWVDAGAIRELKRKATSTFTALRTGDQRSMSVQFRDMSEARVEFEFCEWGKLQMALAAGSQHMNLLNDPTAGLNAGSTENELKLSAQDLARFTTGDLVAVDVDYVDQVGYVGTGVAGSYVKSPGDVLRAPNYIRRVTYNVARVVEKTATSLKLDAPLLGGAPLSDAKLQKVVGFVDREGASFLQEWSALFAMEERSGGRLCFFYPRLQTAASASESEIQTEGETRQMCLHASFVALPVKDDIDGEHVVCYRSYIPASRAPGY